MLRYRRPRRRWAAHRHRRNTTRGKTTKDSRWASRTDRTMVGQVGAGSRDATRSIGSRTDRKRVVSGQSVSVRVDIGGRRIIKKKKKLLSIRTIYSRMTN